MNKKITIILLAILVTSFFLGCAKQLPITEPTLPPKEALAEVDEIETGILDISDVDEELDSSELDDLDTILEDIENI